MINTLQIKKDISFDVADSFLSYSDTITVAEFILPLRAEEIYRGTAIKTAGDLAFALTYDDNEPSNIKAVEETNNYIAGVIADYLVTLNDAEYISFAISHYDEDFCFEDCED